MRKIRVELAQIIYGREIHPKNVRFDRVRMMYTETGSRHPDRHRLCYSETNWQRLRQVRQQFDPAGVFHDYLGSS